VFNETNGNLTVSASSVSSNTGRGLDNRGILSVRDSLVNNNRGGIVNFIGATAIVSGTTIDGNDTALSLSNGGGIYNLGTFVLTGSTVSNNSSGQAASGAGIFNTSSLTISNSTISWNTSGRVSGIENATGATATMNFATVVRNISSSTADPGGIRNSGTLNSRDTIVADNFSTSSAVDFQGTLTSQGYNLVGNTTGATITGTTTGNLLNVNPRLDPILRLNGGATRTHALRLGSPVVDKGASVTGLTSDQRGLIRPVDFPSIPNASGGNGSDIGSFERQLNDIVRTSVAFDFDNAALHLR